MADVEHILDRLEELLTEIESFDAPVRDRVQELVDHLDVLHRSALTHLGDALGRGQVDVLRETHPAIAWLFDAYGVGVDETAAATAALAEVRPYIESHGGEIEVLDAVDGVVHVRLSGSCSGCTASATTLRHGVEEALRESLPGFVRLEATEVEAAPHPPPGPTLLQIEPLRADR